MIEIAKTTEGPSGVGTTYASKVKDAGLKTDREFKLTEFEPPNRIGWTEVSKNLVTVPEGGYYLWLRFPDGVDGDRLATLAEAHGVQVLPASQFHATPGPRNFLRLAYSYASPSEIVEGVRRLGAAFDEYLQGG